METPRSSSRSRAGRSLPSGSAPRSAPWSRRGTLILGFAIFGELVLRYLDVSIESLSIAGGLLLLLVALEMLRGTDFPTGDSGDVALVPLATPLVAGPGAIATAMALWRAHPHAGGTSRWCWRSSRPSHASASSCSSPSG